MAKVNCVDCKHFESDKYFYSQSCKKYTHKMDIPFQNTDISDSIHTAWSKCKGKKFEGKKRWFLWLN